MADNKFKNSIGYGITGALLILSCSICFCAALGRGIYGALLTTVICTLFALKSKTTFFVPSALLITPLFIFTQYTGLLPCLLAVTLGGIICLVLQKKVKSVSLPNAVTAGVFVGLALGTTILLTNTYFGIGACAHTPSEMLKAYGSLGFHPDFRGLLYGTITLFTMITYPFKFRKLNKIIPSEFITVAIPFLLNIALNPNRQRTTTNEYFYATTNITLIGDESLLSCAPTIILTGLALGVLLFFFSKQSAFKPQVNIFTGLISGTPVLPRPIKNYTVISVVTTLFICTLTAVAIPHILTRLPLPCVGAMLIVSAWQQIPFKSIPATIKEKNVISFISMIICAVAFVVLNFYTAVAVSVLATLICNKLSRNPSGKELTE